MGWRKVRNIIVLGMGGMVYRPGHGERHRTTRKHMWPTCALDHEMIRGVERVLR